MTDDIKKIANDILFAGMAVIKNVKHVPLDDVYIDPRDAEIARLRELLDAWTDQAREHLDTELAGRTFEALERTRKC